MTPEKMIPTDRPHCPRLGGDHPHRDEDSVDNRFPYSNVSPSTSTAGFLQCVSFSRRNR